MLNAQTLKGFYARGIICIFFRSYTQLTVLLNCYKFYKYNK